jgi:PAS domain S-box-containing protein
MAMPKRKSSRRPRKPEKPQQARSDPPAQSPSTPEPPLPEDASSQALRDPLLVITLLLGLAATLIIWLAPRPPGVGLLYTGGIWAITLAGAFGRFQARRAALRLEAILAHNQLVSARLAPDITEDESGLGMRHISAWLVGALGVVATAVLWQTGTIARGLEGDKPGALSVFVVGATVSIMLALAVAANAVNRLKTRRLCRDFRAALASERLALDTLAGLDVMISACLPTGERTRFNDRFLKFVGANAAQMRGMGWLEVVHPEDRQGAVDVLARPATTARPREYDLCVRHRDGQFVWLHETLVPRFDSKGKLVEFIATAIDITRRVETEVALDKQANDLKTDLGKSQTELTDIRKELADTKEELSKAKASRNRFETSLNETREEVKNLRDSLAAAEARIVETEAESAERIKEVQAASKERVKAIEAEAEKLVRDVKESLQRRNTELEEELQSRSRELMDSLDAARQETQHAGAENKKLQRAFEKLQEEMAALRLQDGDMREQIARHLKESREARTDADEARKNEAQYRAKVDWLNQRIEELNTQLAARHVALTTAQNEARQAGAAAAADLERRLQEVSAEALATQLRRQLDAAQRMLTEMMATALDGPVKDAAHNTAAAVRAMADLVDQTLKGARKEAQAAATAAQASAPAARSATAASFDLKRTALGVRDMLVADAGARGVKLEIETAPNLRAVFGDEIEIRTALLSLTDAALRLADEGTLTLRLSEDITTGAHATIRCELNHPSARVKTDQLEAALALSSSDDEMPDAAKEPVAFQAAKAWRTFRNLQGQHGFQLPDGGGFSIWFTFTLERPAISGSLRPLPGALPLQSPGAAALAGGPTGAAGAIASAPTAAPSAALPSSPGPPLDPAAAGAAPGGPSAGGRQMPRVPTEYLTCNLGEVIELGADSMRLTCPRPPKGEEVTVALEEVAMDDELRAEVSWCKKLARNKHDVGLKLLGLTQAEQQRLLKVAMQHRKVSTIGSTGIPGQ